MCKNDYWRRKFKEYRELTMKQYDDIDSLENDVKEKDDFVQTIVRARNTYQQEASDLKKKNIELIKDNNDLMEKNVQLDEDAEDGMKMLRNAHARERKLSSEMDELRALTKTNAEKIVEIEKEKEEL